MFCYQCEQTAKGSGCTVRGVCGKDETTARLQDVLVHCAKGIAMHARRAADLGERDPAIDRFVIEALFSTVTNVDFDPERLQGLIRQAVEVRDRAKALHEAAAAKGGKKPEALSGPAAWQPADSIEALTQQAEDLSIAKRRETLGEDVAGLQETSLYGLKGAAAYMDHARVLGKDDAEVFAGFHRVLDFLADDPTQMEDLVAQALKVGELNLKVMELLDAANTEAYGHPEPTEVRVTPVAGKCIVVSGHDLHDLKQLLEQTEGKGVNVYTHGEMLPCCAYPELKKHTHLVGNYGGAWQDQQKEFEAFPGAVLMTTNCIQKPRDSYRDRIFTTGLVAWPDVTHIEADANGKKDFTPVIEAALAAPGFDEDAPEQKIIIGFGHDAVLNVADKVIEAVKAGQIRHFFLVGGCDGARTGRNYYTELAEQIPDDCVILTLACGKYRFNKLAFGDIGGIPRLLDMGQCNDAYSAVRIALALADAFDCGVNDLPLSLILSWYEQKACAILLTLLHLGVKNIRIGPTLPAFVTPPVLQVLVDNYGIKPISTPEEDLAAILG
ncbi:MAG: hydroxylamine reductase [Planctomycetota bacterium]